MGSLRQIIDQMIDLPNWHPDQMSKIDYAWRGRSRNYTFWIVWW